MHCVDIVNKAMRAVCCGHPNVVRELDMEGTDYFTKDGNSTTLIEMTRRMNKCCSVVVPNCDDQG